MPTYRKRAFLTGHDADSYIKYYVDYTPYKDGKDGPSRPHLHADLKIADCHRTINLDFGAWEMNTKEKRKKVENTRRLMNEFLDLIEEHLDYYEINYKEYKQARKEYNGRTKRKAKS